MKKICPEQKCHPPIRATLEEATFHTFPYWTLSEPFKLQKVGSARRVTHFVQSPFCNGRVSLLAGPTFLRRHFTRFPLNNNSCLKFRKNHVSSGRYIPVAETKPKPPRVWSLIFGPGENNFVKWKETFRSDRLDQIRSVSVKARIAKARQLEHSRRPVGVIVFFFSRLGGWLSYTRQVFSI